MSVDPSLIDPKAGPLAQRSGKGGIFWGLVFLAHSVLLVALAVSPSFAEGRATFHAEWARFLTGVLGVLLGAVALRGLLRSLRGWSPPPMEGSRRTRGRVVGILFMDVATVLMLVVFVTPIAEATVELHGWVRWYVGVMAVLYLMLGLVFFIVARPQASTQSRSTPRNPGRAVIHEVRDTGITSGDSPRVELDLDISADGDDPRRITWKGYVPRLAIGRLVPGDELPILVDPLDIDNIEIEWGKR